MSKTEGTFAPSARPGVKNLVQAASEPVVEHAGTGYRIPESIARLIDEQAKVLPKDFTYRRMAAAPLEFDLPDGERTDVSFITTDAVDRDNEVVLPQGIDWRGFNGVVPPFHKYDQLPVGVCWWIRPRMAGNNNGLIAKTHYPTKPADWGDGTPWLPSAVLHLMQQPIPVCTGKSIGFLPLEIRNPTAEEKGKRPEWKDKPIISKSLGLEYSVVTVPANAPSEMVAVSKALAAAKDDKSVADALELLAKSLKDMADGDGEISDSMPPCPKCMTNAHVETLTDAVSTDGTIATLPVTHVRSMSMSRYRCKTCGMEFGNGHDADDAAAEQEKAIAAALAAPYYTEDAYRKQQERIIAAAKEQVRRDTLNAINLALAGMAGKV